MELRSDGSHVPGLVGLKMADDRPPEIRMTSEMPRLLHGLLNLVLPEQPNPSLIGLRDKVHTLVFAHWQQSHFARDRKSTRLNSSHGYISYAVFCLKKK